MHDDLISKLLGTDEPSNCSTDEFPKISIEEIQNLSNLHNKYRQQNLDLFLDWMSIFEIEEKYSNQLLDLLKIPHSTVNFLNAILRGNLSIGHYRQRIWKKSILHYKNLLKNSLIHYLL